VGAQDGGSIERHASGRQVPVMSLSFSLRHAFPTTTMDMAFDVPTQGITALFGPSGSGKSTIISVASGLLRPDHCRVSVDGTVLADTDAGIWLPTERRRVGLVFQDARLFPHMSVATNLRYGQRRAPPGNIAFDDVVSLLGIDGLLNRRPHTLSGGERQRIAIGRALLSQPLLLMMDEPLASLDTARKDEILPYLAGLRTTLRLPILYVTHSLTEVARLADSLVLVQAGRIVAAGPLNEVTARSDVLLAQRDDAAVVLPARVMAHDPTRRLSALEAGGRSLLVPLVAGAVGSELRVRIPAREVILAGEAPESISVHNIIAGSVRAITQDDARHATLVEVALPEGALLSRVTPDAIANLRLAPGSPVLALVKSVAVEVLGTSPGNDGSAHTATRLHQPGHSLPA
jgi:molybdate transport system ATP-binding protein